VCDRLGTSFWPGWGRVGLLSATSLTVNLRCPTVPSTAS